MVIGVAKVREHEHLMMRLNSVPLEQRADHPRLEEAVRLLLCHHHKHTDFDKELEDASQKFQDAAEAAKEAEAARIKREKPAPQKRPGILRKTTVQFFTPFPLPVTRRGAELAEGSAANSGRSGRRLQARDIPSESGSEFESDSDSESDSSDDDDVHPLKALKRYDSKWKAIEKSGLEEGLPVVDQVLWPVASGKHQDVNKEAVATFFNNVADEHDKTGCRAISSHERMRWYSRNIKDTFGRDVYEGILKKELKMISSAAKEFRKLYSQ
ncbi:hypothetical protein FOC4_g10010621 [Fusarium odoratissimum]|uniref:Uncharacterized protein n=2 Tax=Fusarium oxysporum f. sp. cubense (strain race 4) TaxID=2502994 RepID=N1RCA9_FUSC4|nr:uncharacterized protein FOIG_05528 [Fusarium odoratissimum NRRL 54006]EMT64133.1 hypothetical protein FOC4_g10010621 [Fusarium odoratissimum]EXM03900.1 hypothetical protein FOIG_05528 [Fusarium odoratissimum NRRL 54006]